MSILRFLLANARYLAFGFLLTFVSSFGQTFFIGLFKGRLLETFDGLTHGSYGGYYALATLASAAVFFFLGPRIDRVDLRWFALLTCCGLAVACMAKSLAHSLTTLWLALFGLRLFGQGLLSHTATTATARYFDHHRGRALSVVNLGHPVGEAVLPLMLVALLSHFDWRTCWQLHAGFVALAVMPAVALLLRGHGSRHAQLLARVADHASGTGDRPVRQWTVREVRRDPRFYLVLPAVLAPPFLTTGLLFHQDLLRAAFDWSPERFASSFVVYSAAQVSVMPLAGILVDRYSAQRILPLYLAPYAVALLCLWQLEGGTLAFVLMAGAGLSSGIGFSAVGSLWAERYGVVHLGAIRTLVAVLMVASTAISPPLMGVLVDQGVPVRGVIAGMLAWTVVAMGLLWIGPARRVPGPAQ